MRIAIIADTFPPLRTSGAVQLRDLSREFVRQGHVVSVLLPETNQRESWREEEIDGLQIMRLKAPKSKDVGYFRRTLAELLMPFFMLTNIRKSTLALERWDGVVWYSPSIFHGPFVSSLKKSSRCKSYLIIRDIFPEWAVDMGLMGRGLPYQFFSAIARYQYAVADTIGIQTPGNSVYFRLWSKHPKRKLEVLQNWLDRPAKVPCSLKVEDTILVGRKIFVYAGNMGVAQGLDIFIDLATKLKSRQDVGFLFVGRGSELPRLKTKTQVLQLDNLVFFDEIDPDEIPELYAQCKAGIVALDPRHKSHNIPGKFLTYMQNGLPVLANVNSGNDLCLMIREEQVGYVCETNRVEELQDSIEKLLLQIETDSRISNRCKNLFEREFAVETKVKQIVKALLEQE
jgi:glycosyltransferase involved in cell wall biosynthesis